MKEVADVGSLVVKVSEPFEASKAWFWLVDGEERELARTRKGVAVDPAEDAREDAEETGVEAVGDEVTRLENPPMRVEETKVGDGLARLEALLLCADEE